MVQQPLQREDSSRADAILGRLFPEWFRKCNPVYYLIFLPKTAATYRSSCVYLSIFYIWGGIVSAILFCMLRTAQGTWLAVALLACAIVISFGVLALIAARRSQTLNQSIVTLVAGANYAMLAVVCLAVGAWPILWLTVAFWAPMLVRFHRHGLRLLAEAE